MSSSEAPFDERPSMEYALPQGIYSSCRIIVHGGGKEEYSCPDGILTYCILLPQFFFLVLNYVMQFGFVYYIYSLLKADKLCELDTDPWLRLLATMAFAVSMTKELDETKNMVLWLYHIKTEDDHRKLRIKEIDGEKVIDTGLTAIQKLLFMCQAIIPKYVVALLLIHFGGMYIKHSESDSDLILNCAALSFILEFDTVLYQAFTPPFCQRILDELPPIKSDDHGASMRGLLLMPFMRGIVFVGIVTWIMAGPFSDQFCEE